MNNNEYESTETNSNYNSDSNDSDYDYDTDTDTTEYEEIEYEPEEESLTKFNIVICERTNITIYNDSNNSNKDTDDLYYLVHFRLKQFNYENIMNLYQNFFNNKCFIEIAEIKYLASGFPFGYCTGILKTFWIRLIQRSYKNLYKRKLICIKQRLSLNALRHREIHGIWPPYCNIYPSLKGMLSHLSRSSL